MVAYGGWYDEPDEVVESGRLCRAVHLDARRISATTYLVRGGAEPHTVEVVNGACHCDCVDFNVRGVGYCKHTLSVRLSEGDRDLIRALRRVVPRLTRRARVAA